MTTPVELLSLKAICARYSISYTTVYEAVQSGDLPAEFSRGRWRVDPVDAVTWLRSADDHKTNQVSA